MLNRLRRNQKAYLPATRATYADKCDIENYYKNLVRSFDIEEKFIQAETSKDTYIILALWEEHKAQGLLRERFFINNPYTPNSVLKELVEEDKGLWCSELAERELLSYPIFECIVEALKNSETNEAYIEYDIVIENLSYNDRAIKYMLYEIKRETGEDISELPASWITKIYFTQI